MKMQALDIFACPRCHSSFELKDAVMHDGEVSEGVLACRGCQVAFPVIRGVPRFVAAGSYASSFGRQWQWFRTVQIDSLNGAHTSRDSLRGATGWEAGDIKGRLVLDAGAGAGRFAECIADQGGRIVGVDLTEAIDAAYRNIGRRPDVHLAQADIFALPFREGTFDLAYSIGVLHHTPDPAAAFSCVARTVKPAGQMAVYIYSRYGAHVRVPDAIRTVTTRLPKRLMFVLSTAAIPAYYVYRVPLLGRLLKLILPISMLPQWRWRWLDTFDWYTPKYQFKFMYPEVFRWFRANGFHDVEIYDDPIRMRGEKAQSDLHSDHHDGTDTADALVAAARG